MESKAYIRAVIQREIENELKKFGEFTWAYIVLQKKSMQLAFYATNYPQEWVTHYFENNLQCTDPVVSIGLKSLTPFAWNKQTKGSSYPHGDDLLARAAEYDINAGYTFVLYDYFNNLAMLTLLVNRDVVKDIQYLLHFHKDRLNLFLARLHEKYLSLDFSEKYSKPASSTLLTPRENAILYWASVGKTYEEVGIILGIKTTTVKFHMANIVKKLGVANARQAVCLSVELRLIKPEN
ncbi:helix-turn-helix transcriptional regulator [Erwinia sp. CGal63]|uniref:helix-turn-helix transcriptional regulator n=1 Tax=Erwinia sp. CGal63 TaxID=2919889 RepID=UPI00300844DE